MKPVVHYIHRSNTPYLQLQGWAWVEVVDHPKHKPFTLVKTSGVVAIGSSGIFETRNTIYRPL